jgi:hypothetical protein
LTSAVQRHSERPAGNKMENFVQQLADWAVKDRNAPALPAAATRTRSGRWSHETPNPWSSLNCPRFSAGNSRPGLPRSRRWRAVLPACPNLSTSSDSLSLNPGHPAVSPSSVVSTTPRKRCGSWADLCRLPRRRTPGQRRPGDLLDSFSRYYKFLPSEQQRAFLENLCQKAS